MFGIEKIQKKFKAIDLLLTALTRCQTEDRNHIKSIQSTNDKRYNEIDKKITTILNRVEDCWTDDDTVKCDKCKCYLDKRDAIRGKSRIVKDTDSVYLTATAVYMGMYREPDESIQEVYYCHKCGGKLEKSGNKKTRSTVVKTNKK